MQEQLLKTNPMYPEFIRAEYLQKRKTRTQWIGRLGLFAFIAFQIAGFSALLYLVCVQ